MPEDFQIRADDFRRAWPNALHRALVESCDLAEALDEQRVRVEELTRQMPEMISELRVRLSEVTEAHLAQIEKANALLFEEQAKFMAAFAAQGQALELARSKAQAAQRELDKSREDFSQLGFFKRLFAKV